MNAQIVLSEFIQAFYVKKNGLKICKWKAKLQAYIKAKTMALGYWISHKAKERLIHLYTLKFKLKFACYVTDKGSI